MESHLPRLAEDWSVADTVTKSTAHDHLCLFYRTQEEQFAAVMPYLAEGLRRGEQCLYLVDESSPDEIRRALCNYGINVAEAVHAGQLNISRATDAYLNDGSFDPEWMISFLRETMAAARTSGVTTTRATGEMTWGLSQGPGTERLGEYESKLNDFFPEHKLIGMCQYNLNRFPMETIRQMIRTHRLVVTDSLVCLNQFYQSPDQFERHSDTLDTTASLEHIFTQQAQDNHRQATNRIAERQLAPTGQFNATPAR